MYKRQLHYLPVNVLMTLRTQTVVLLNFHLVREQDLLSKLSCLFLQRAVLFAQFEIHKYASFLK